MVEKNQMKTTFQKLVREKKKLINLESKTNAQKKVVTELQEEMMDLMIASGTTSYKGTTASLSLVTSNVPTLKDFGKFTTWIKKHNAFDLLQKRISTTAYRDRVENGEKIPGVDTFVKNSLRISLK